MGSNRFQYVPEAVQSGVKMPSIVTLRLSNNQITFLLDGHFSNLTILRELYVESLPFITSYHLKLEVI